MPGLGGQLADIDIEIRFIAQDFKSLVDVKLSPLLAGGGDCITKILTQKVIHEKYSIFFGHDLNFTNLLYLQRTIKKINEREARYQVVMRNLIKRYIMNKSREKIDEGVTGKLVI